MAAKKKPQKKASSKKASFASTGGRLTKKQYEALHAGTINDIERLEKDLNLDLKELKRKLHCFCHYYGGGPVHGAKC